MKRKSKASKLAYAAYRFAHWLLASLPVDAAFRLGQALGFLAWLLLPGYRRLALHNVRIALGDVKPPHELSRIVRAHFRSLGANLLCAPALSRLPAARLIERVDMRDLRKISSVSERRAGVIVVLSHIGNWELLAQVAALEPSLKSAAIYQALANPLIDAHVRTTRQARGLKLFSRVDGFEAPIRHVRGGGLLGVLADQHAGDKGIWTPFFGRIASTSPLVAIIAMRTGAPVLSAAMQTAGCARWRLVVDEPLDVQGRDRADITACVNRAIEKQILRQPEDWFWVHNRWKTPRPAFLLQHYRRGVHLPSDFDTTALKPFRILVRSSNWLGDAVMSTPAVQAIKQGRPDTHVTVLCKAKLEEFWQVVPWVDEVVAIPEKGGVLGTVQRLRKLPAFDAGIALPNSLRVGLELLLAGVPRRVGYAGHHRSWTLNQIVPQRAGMLRAEHHVQHYIRLAAHIGAKTEAVGFGLPRETPPLPAKPEPEHCLLGLCPGAEYGGAKRWPIERFAAVANEVLKRRLCRWVIFGTTKEATLCETLRTAIEGDVENLAGRTSLTELIAWLRRCRALLTNDTGTMHLAAFLGVPVVAIFGSTEPRLTGPPGSGHIVLRHQVECSPCFLRECPLDFRCMKAVEVDEAVESVLRLLSEPLTPPACVSGK